MQAVNEDSLKQLSLALETLQQKRRIRPTVLSFYLRSKDEKKLKAGKLKLVKINLDDQDIRKTILSILRTCNLSTSFVDEIKEQESEKSNLNLSNPFNNRDPFNFADLENDPIFAAILMRRKINLEPDTLKYVTS